MGVKAQGKVYTKIILDTTSCTLIPMPQGKVVPDRVVYMDSFRSYNVLDVSEFEHYRINHSQLFAKNHTHINKIEDFLNQANNSKF